MPTAPPVVLTIAGFDPSSGAGITADIKVIAAQERYGVACITALTVQSTQGVARVEAIDPEVIAASLEMLISDFAIGAVHIGMLANEQVVGTVADFLDRSRLPHPPYRFFPGLCPSWDNSVRRREGGVILKDSTPAKYQAWLRELLYRSALHRES